MAVVERHLPESPAALSRALAGTGYLPDTGLATAGWLALRLDRPLFLEGDAGVGKTSFAAALAEATGLELIRLQCYEGLDLAQALYDWDFPRQVLHLRTWEAVGSRPGADRAAADQAAADPPAVSPTAVDPAAVEASLYDRRFLLARPLLRALESAPCVLLIDEVDRADDEFEAYLLELLSDWAVSIPELGRIVAPVPPTVVVTSNRTREVHDALKRRCLYHWVEHPDPAREVEILRLRLPEVTARLARQVAEATARLRDLDLAKAPGIAEAIDWARALHVLGARELTAEVAEETAGAVVKLREDLQRVRELGWDALLSGDHSGDLTGDSTGDLAGDSM